MIQCWVTKGNGGMLTLPTAISWRFRYGTDTPCDSYEVKCLWEKGQEKELSDASRFYAQWEDERVFTGVVDEYAVVCGKEGLYLEISGRGMAALLLDNEAMPAQYQLATRAVILADHVTPYGITAIGGSGLTPVNNFTVRSGESEWSAMRDFVCCYNGVAPRFDRMGRLVLDPHDDDEILRVTDGTAVISWEYREDRHGVLSQVAVRRRSYPGMQWVSDEGFIAEGGRARRVITVPNITGTTAMRYTADYQLKASRRERKRMTVALAGAFLAWPGQLVDVSLAGCGANGRYRAAQAEVSCGDNGLTTTLTLGEPDSMI